MGSVILVYLPKEKKKDKQEKKVTQYVDVGTGSINILTSNIMDECLYSSMPVS